MKKSEYSFDLQELWFSLTRSDWSSLAVVPAHEGRPALALCNSLAALGGVLRGAPLPVFDGVDLDLEAAASLALDLQAAQLEERPTGHERRLVALGPLTQNPMGIPVCLACDAVLLMMESGITTHASAQRTLELVGRDRVIGSVLYARPG